MYASGQGTLDAIGYIHGSTFDRRSFPQPDNSLGGAEFFTLQPHLEVPSSVRYTAVPCALSGSFARTHMPCQ